MDILIGVNIIIYSYINVIGNYFNILLFVVIKLSLICLIF